MYINFTNLINVILQIKIMLKMKKKPKSMTKRYHEANKQEIC